MEQLLAGGMRVMNAKGAAAVLMDVHTGEVIALASLPDFDPNHRPVGSGKNPTTHCSTVLCKAFMNWGQRLKYLRLRKRWNWVWSIQTPCSTFVDQ